MNGADIPQPEREHYDDVTPSTVTLLVEGERTPAMVFHPSSPGPVPGIAIGQEATGPNTFIRSVAATLAHLGYATVVPDYYHGGGPSDPENYEDLDGIVEHMADLDFRRGADDMIAGIDYLKSLASVDPQRLGVWGYCTGATMALLAAALDRTVRASILFYPSQPRFTALGVKTPIHPIDLIWNIRSPVLWITGEADPVWPSDLLAEVRQRLTRWHIAHRIRTYPNAGHAFCSPAPTLHHADAARAAWVDAVAFVATHLGATAPSAGA